MPGFLPDVPLVREDLADYMGEASAFDAGLGVLLKKIEEMGELDNTLGDIDAGPTKAYLIENRNNKEVNGAYYFDLACGKRPQEELFHIPDDPWTMHNVADLPENQPIRKELHDRLMKLLYENADPRVLDGARCIYEQPDYRKVMWK
jgi:arylsulfatase A-like enzyme